MNPIFESMPIWLAIIISGFVLLGAFLTLTGMVGLIRMRKFYERLHPPTLGTSWGTGSIVIASILLFTWAETRPVFHEILIGIFITLTTPVTLMLLARAVLYRDWAEGDENSPLLRQQSETPKQADE